MTLLEIVLRPWKAQAEIKRIELAEWQTEAYWNELKALRAEMAVAEVELQEATNELNWLEAGPGVKRVEGGWVVRFYPLNVQPVWKTLREAIRYGMEAD